MKQKEKLNQIGAALNTVLCHLSEGYGSIPFNEALAKLRELGVPVHLVGDTNEQAKEVSARLVYPER